MGARGDDKGRSAVREKRKDVYFAVGVGEKAVKAEAFCVQDSVCTLCGAQLHYIRDKTGRRFIHNFGVAGYAGCSRQGRVYRMDLSFAGYWVDREYIKNTFRF